MKMRAGMRSVYLIGVILTLILVLGVIALHSLRVGILARPDGVPSQARNLGTVIQPSYWHWCQDENSERYCETYPRQGGFPIYSGYYLPVGPETISDMASLDVHSYPDAHEITNLFRLSTIYDKGYNWPLVERLSPLGGRRHWSYRFIFPNCLQAISNSNIDEFIENSSDWKIENEILYFEEISQLFSKIDVNFQRVSEHEAAISDPFAGVDGVVEINQYGQCFGRMTLIVDDG